MSAPSPGPLPSPLAGRRIGMLAGWGKFPLVVAETLRQHGACIYGLGVKDHVDPTFKHYCHAYRTIGLAKLGTAIRFFRRHGVAEATMAGKIHKTLLFKRFYWLKHLPDLLMLRTFYPHFITHSKDRKDDTLLGTIVETFAKYGIHFAPATDFAPELLVKHGMIAGERLSDRQAKDVRFGWELAREMGRLDVGQSVAVKGQAVLAVEAVEGTDACIRRAGTLCPAGGFTLVKVAKPQQDMRFDVPTIGLLTLQTLHQAGGSLLAVEADRTIFLDQATVVDFARNHGIKIVALRDEAALETIPQAA